MTEELPTPRKVVTFPIAAEPDAGALFVFGDANSAEIVLMCAGFPDDHEIFVPLANRLANEGGYLVGVTCLPGFDDREDFPYTRHKKEGYTCGEMVASMREATKAVRNESTYSDGKGGQAKLTGIYHDWGVIPGLILTNRCIQEKNDMLSPDRVVLFDVLGPPHPSRLKDMPDVPNKTYYEVIVTWTYRVIMAIAFSIRLYISKILALIFAGLALTILGLLRLSPTYEIDAKVIQSRRHPIKFDRLIYMAYPYAAMFRGRIEGFSLPKDLVKTPVLYMYGTKKRIMFHDKRALMVLEREERKGRMSKAISVEDAGHWLYLQQPDICFEEVVKFIRDA